MADTLNLGLLFTQPLDADAAGHLELTGIGTFEVNVTTSRKKFEANSDKLGTFKTLVAAHLAHAIEESEVPSHLWVFQPTREVRAHFSLPKLMPMKV